MVRGLDVFRNHFCDFAECYVLIGGTACDLAMDEAGVQFRATKDLDIVLCAEALNADFARAFWEFIALGEYEIRETATGEKCFYRFTRPGNAAYPFMLELFSRKPDVLTVPDGCHLTPIPVDEEVSSLSAILLDEDYYHWIQTGMRHLEGVPIVGPEHLIPLKANAWLDLRSRHAVGEEIDSRSIKKHKNDIARLFQVIDPEQRLIPPNKIVEDMQRFLEELAADPIDFKSLKITSVTSDQMAATLRKIYGL